MTTDTTLPGTTPPATTQPGPPPSDPAAEQDPYATFAPEPDDEPVVVPRRHHVTAVLVAHDGARWLPATLTSLARATRHPDVLVGVDTGSTDDTAALLAASLGEDRVVTLARETGFGAALAAGLAASPAPAADDPEADEDDAPLVRWVWLLHDDSAPAPDALAQLLRASDLSPSAEVLGPKVRGWHDRRLLLEVGLTVTGSGRRETGLERGETDQGQHDGTRDVLAVGSAGMLVRREVWDALGGLDPRLALFRDDIDFGWRARVSGHRVVVATDAVVHHAEAGAHGRRPLAAVDGSPQRADRESALYSALVHARGLALPFVVLRAVVGTVVGVLALLLAKAPGDAADELAALVFVLVRPGRVLAGRRALAAQRTLPNSALAGLRPRPGSQLRHSLEALGGVLAGGRTDTDTRYGAMESGPTDDDADYAPDDSRWLRALRRPGAVLSLGLLAVALVGVRAWYGLGRLEGGALLPSPEGAGDLWATYSQGWHDVATGAPTAAPPYLAVLTGIAGALLGSAPRAVEGLLMLAVPLAGMSAYLALRGVVRGRGLRVLAAAAYALLPAVTGAMAAGRLGTAMLAVLLPPLVRVGVRVPERWRTAWGGALLLAVAAAFVPAVWLVAVVVGLVAAVLVVRGPAAWGRLAVFLLVPVALLLPWSGHVARHPALLLLEPGLPGPTDTGLTPWQVLLLHPGGPGMTPLWMTAGVLLGGLVALMRTSTRGRVLAAWALGLAALALGLVQTVITVVPPTQLAAVTPWPGAATLMLGAALLAATAIAADGVLGGLSDQGFGWKQLGAAALVVALVLAPVASAAVLVVRGIGGTVVRTDETVVPAFVAADSASASLPRTLVLRTPGGGVSYALITGEGPQLGDAETGPPGSAYTRLDTLVGDLVAGRAGGEVTELATYAVRYVVLARPADPAVARVLDSLPGLRRLSSADGDTLWRLEPVSDRVRVAQANRPAAPLPVPAAMVDGAPAVSTELPTGTEGGDRLAVAESRDPGWSATLTTPSGTVDLQPARGASLDRDWRLVYDLPASAGTVAVAYDQGPRTRWLWLQALLVAVVVVLALPGRRRETVDPDADVAGEDEPRWVPAPDAAEGPLAADPRRSLGSDLGVEPAEPPAEPAEPADRKADEAGADPVDATHATPEDSEDPEGLEDREDREDREDPEGLEDREDPEDPEGPEPGQGHVKVTRKDGDG